MYYGGLFDPESKKNKITELEKKVLETNFWDDKKNSEEVLSELNELKSKLNSVESIKCNIESNLEIIDLIKDNEDYDMHKLIENDIGKLTNELDKVELELLLNEPYDKCDCILEIHPGAGGTESCDWASMLYRMYTRWCEKNNKKMELLDYQEGEEAGKGIACICNGSY